MVWRTEKSKVLAMGWSVYFRSPPPGDGVSSSRRVGKFPLLLRIQIPSSHLSKAGFFTSSLGAWDFSTGVREDKDIQPVV